MAKDRGDVEKFGKPLLDNLKRIEDLTAHWSGMMEPDARALFQDCAEKLRKFILLRVDLVESARSMGAEAANKIGNNDANRSTREALNKTVVALAQRNNDDIARLAGEMARFEQTASTVLPAVTAAGIALTAVLAAWMVIGGITRPLSRMTSALRQLANGDLLAPVEVRNRGGEIGHIAEALEVFRMQAAENQRLKVERDEQQRSTEVAKRLALVRMVETIEDTSSVAMLEISRQCDGLAATASEMRTRADRIGLSARGAGVALVAASALEHRAAA